MINYSGIEEKFGDEPPPKLIISREKLGSEGFFSRFILGDERDYTKTMSIGHGHYLQGALEQTNNQNVFRRFVGAHDKIDKNKKHTFLENLLKLDGYHLLIEKVGIYIETSIAKYNKNRFRYEKLFSVLNPTFSESLFVLNSNREKINNLLSTLVFGRNIYKLKISELNIN